MPSILALTLFGETAASAIAGGSGPEAIGDPAYWVDLNSDTPSCSEGLSRACLSVGVSDREQSPDPVRVELMIDAKGRVSQCVIISSNQDRLVDYQICNSLRRRASFQPARDEGGQPIASAWPMTLSFSNVPGGDHRSFPAKPDIVVTTNRLRPGETGKLVVVREVIRPDSSSESCVVQRSSENLEIDALACNAVHASIDPTPVVDAKDNPIRGVRLFVVGFLPN